MEFAPLPQGTTRRRTGTRAEPPLNPAETRYTDPSLPAAGEITHMYTGAGRAPGTLWFGWMHGSAVAAQNRDPRIQVMQYNEDTYILRQNICVDWRGAFTYLLFGNEGALLIDTGATPDAHLYPLRAMVEALMTRWVEIRRKRAVPLTVFLTSAEDADQNAGLTQFAGKPDCRIWPRPAAGGESQIDLGGRVLDVLPTPGTHHDGFSVYDRYTELLFTGDLLFPGRILLANERDYLGSLQRLQRWKNSHPVKWVTGGHVDMQIVPGRAYGRFATFKPLERELQLEPETIDEALGAAQEIAGRPVVLPRRNFWLLHGVGPDERPESFPDNLPGLAGPRPV